MGGEAKNAKRDVPIAVITSLLVQGAFCYLIEYFAANYFLNSGYTDAERSRLRGADRRHDDHRRQRLFGPGDGRIFMLVEAFTVFLALIGTTLSCMNTGARVTYAMGKDEEVPEHFGMLHSKNLTPHRAIWTLAAISAVVGCLAVSMVFGDAGAPQDADHQGAAAGLLLQLRLHHARQDGGAAEFAADHYAGFELRHVPAVHAELHHLHRGVTTTIPKFSFAASTCSFRSSGCLRTWPAWRSTWSGRSWATAPRWNRCWPWVSRRSGASTAASTSCSSSKAKGRTTLVDAAACNRHSLSIPRAVADHRLS